MRLRRERQAVLAMGLAAISLLAVALPLALADDDGSRLQTTASAPDTRAQAPVTTSPLLPGSQEALSVAPGDVLPGTYTTSPTTAPLRAGLGALSPAFRSPGRGDTPPARPGGGGSPTTAPGNNGGGNGGGSGGSDTTSPPNSPPPTNAPCQGTDPNVAKRDEVLFTRGGDIFMINSADPSGGAVNLTNTPTDIESGPTWAPTGARVAFTFNSQGIYTLDSGRPQLEKKFVAGTEGLVSDPAYSPDGRFIAFIRDGDLFRVSANGGTSVRIYDFPQPASNPTWSPNSCGVIVSTGGALWIVERTGEEAARIRNGTAPSWSASQNRVAFVDGDQVWTIGPDNSDLQPVTEAAEGAAPAWEGGDGSRIAYARGGQVFVTGNANALTEGPADAEPAW
jgi:hypothetical protein